MLTKLTVTEGKLNGEQLLALGKFLPQLVEVSIVCAKEIAVEIVKFIRISKHLKSFTMGNFFDASSHSILQAHLANEWNMGYKRNGYCLTRKS